MAEIIMPKMGDAMTEGKVVKWYKKAGEPVKKGEPLLEIETDKSHIDLDSKTKKVNLDLEAEADGTLGNLEAQEGQTVAVGGVLARILGSGEKPSAAPAPKKTEDGSPQQRRATDKKDSFKHSTGEYGETLEMKGPRVDRTQNVVQMPQSSQGGRRRSSPLARKMARELGVC